MNEQDELLVERVGGFAGFGGTGSRLTSKGTVSMAKLDSMDRLTVEGFFSGTLMSAKRAPDAFRYRLTKRTGKGTRTVEVAEEDLPLAIRNAVKDSLE
jgi:hypothetical protein